jgi:hypothetical protein
MIGPLAVWQPDGLFELMEVVFEARKGRGGPFRPGRRDVSASGAWISAATLVRADKQVFQAEPEGTSDGGDVAQCAVVVVAMQQGAAVVAPRDGQVPTRALMGRAAGFP